MVQEYGQKCGGCMWMTEFRENGLNDPLSNSSLFEQKSTHHATGTHNATFHTRIFAWSVLDSFGTFSQQTHQAPPFRCNMSATLDQRGFSDSCGGFSYSSHRMSP